MHVSWVVGLVASRARLHATVPIFGGKPRGFLAFTDRAGETVADTIINGV